MIQRKYNFAHWRYTVNGAIRTQLLANDAEKILHTQKLETLKERCDRVLFKTSTVWPFDMFPADVTIDESKINVVQREFFSSETIHSIPIKSIRDIELECSVFFATLHVVPDGYPRKEVVVRHLKKGDAIRARRIIQGLIVITKEQIDLTKVDDEDIERNVEKIGTAWETNS